MKKLEEKSAWSISGKVTFSKLVLAFLKFYSSADLNILLLSAKKIINLFLDRTPSNKFIKSEANLSLRQC